MPIAASELIINDDGSIYHLGLKPEDLGDKVITVGDPERVAMVSKYFDSIEMEVNKREFVTHTGRLGTQRISVVSTGIGTDNVDIVLNEIDALVNVDFASREIKSTKKSIDIIRIGTSGTIRAEIPMDEIIISRGAIGLDGLCHFYDRSVNSEEEQILKWDIPWPIKPYYSWGSDQLASQFSKLGQSGITITNTGFYGPQSRTIRLKPKVDHFFEMLENQTIDGYNITNLEMETSGLYCLSELLGHRCVSINAILANRKLGLFSKNPGVTVDKTIRAVLELI